MGAGSYVTAGSTNGNSMVVGVVGLGGGSSKFTMNILSRAEYDSNTWGTPALYGKADVHYKLDWGDYPYPTYTPVATYSSTVGEMNVTSLGLRTVGNTLVYGVIRVFRRVVLESAGGGISIDVTNLTNVNIGDLPSFTGNAGKVLIVNEAGTGVEFQEFDDGQFEGSGVFNRTTYVDFTAAAPYQKVKVLFGDDSCYSGRFSAEVKVISMYGSLVEKTFWFLTNSEGQLVSNVAEYTKVAGYDQTSWAIMDAVYDAGEESFSIPVANRGSAADDITIEVKLAFNPSLANKFKNLRFGSIYTTDQTTPDAPVLGYRSGDI
jgi:hypothetical protein